MEARERLKVREATRLVVIRPKVHVLQLLHIQYHPSSTEFQMHTRAELEREL